MIAAGIILFRQRLLGLCFGVVRAGEVGRAADRLGQKRVDRLERQLRGLAGRDLLRVGGEAVEIVRRGRKSVGQARRPSGGRTLACSGAGGEPGAASPRARPAHRAPGRAPGARAMSAGISNGGRVPAELLARRGDFVGAERGAVGGGGALLVGRAEADDRAAGDQRRARIGERFVDARGGRRRRRGRRSGTTCQP